MKSRMKLSLERLLNLHTISILSKMLYDMLDNYAPLNFWIVPTENLPTGDMYNREIKCMLRNLQQAIDEVDARFVSLVELEKKIHDLVDVAQKISYADLKAIIKLCKEEAEQIYIKEYADFMKLDNEYGF